MTTTTFFTYADTLVKRKRKAGKHATADLYRASSNWFRVFCDNAELSFTDITPGMIDHFHIWLQAGGSLKTNSINSYLSSLRAIYNTAVREGLAPADRLSPFVHLILRAEETAKRALRNDTPVAVISQMLGHTSEKTTRHYLAKLDQSKLDAANKIITKGLDSLVGVRA